MDVKSRGLGGLDGILGFHLRLAHGAVYRHFTETFANLDLTQKQVSALWLAAEEPGISQVELGRKLSMDRATTMTIVNRLQDRDFVRRERSDSDGRKQALHVTPTGLAALDEAKVCIAEHEKWLKARFTAAEVEKLVEMLTRIHE
ncbi:MarR family transcriptional regulator [Croceibacterium sp. LX-88]|jgi:DNA-binding MarR family transcriptional regulator|uniref:MarR family transcriptional regulator n=2 Tax=Croceibacterium selenioxidans TaxID=2838833 RepID=A0ABS5W6N8_9SPHN|nr:MarR family transcriptional regulator [Croceibacterium selenioxidans]MBT2134910.1 MarR family transcriptional regulator [Croceibacterium selenioxidans]